jgi:hypothetical protein
VTTTIDIMILKSNISRLTIVATMLGQLLVPLQAQVADEVDWPAFLSRHDMVWERLPDRFENAAFTGNGQLGAMFFTTDAGRALKWQIGRSDVAFNRSRIPIGDLVLTPQGKILGGEMRLDLWNAEVPPAMVARVLAGGFVSMPDTRMEGFYHIQMYKMASATRPGRPALDLMGPWFRTTPWAKIWWNLNIQLAYWPQLTGNRMELGESLAN